MSGRREFRKAARVAIIKRATDAKGVTRCEECAAVTRQFEIHHIKPDGMETDKTSVLTAAEGALLCKPCHLKHTKEDVPAIAKAKRVEARHLGIRKQVHPAAQIRSAPMATTARAAARAARGHREPAVRKVNVYGHPA